MWSLQREVPLSHEEFDEVFRREYPGMLRLATLLVGDADAARDITQEAFARAFASWRRIGGYDRPGAWIRRVLIRIAGRAVGERQHDQLDPDVAMATNDRELDHVVRSLVATLPYQQRAAVVLTYYGGYPSAEAADAMGCSESTVRVHLHRARQTLGAALQMEVDDAGR